MAASALYIRDYHKEIPGNLSPDRKTWLFPQINSKNAHGKVTEWRICVKLFKHREDIVLPAVPEDAFMILDDSYFDNKPLPDDFRGWIKVDSRIAGGEIKKSVPTIVHKGKNPGKVSATNVFCQALRDAYGLHNKQLKKAVTHARAVTAAERYPPMLAQVLKDLKTPIKIGPDHIVYVQRKYNGVRTVTTLDCSEAAVAADCVPIMYSRRKLLYPGFQYIKDELKPVLEMYWSEQRQIYLDGEIYKHGVALQDISGQARRESQPGDVHYDYMIYDCFIANEPGLKYSERKKILDEIFENFELKYCKPVETFDADSHEEVDELYKVFLEEGFEGAMVRLDEPYRYSYNEYHSRILLKMKPTHDAEYTIAGWETGEKGKAAEALMIICQTADGKKFPVTPAMEIPDRIALARKMKSIEENGKTHFENHWAGKPLIVYYDELSKDNVPQRARTKMEIRTWA
jgi:ATP-dependent DNA ligase